MTTASDLLANLTAKRDAAKAAYFAACGNEYVSVADFVRLGREYAAADAKLDGACEMARAIIADEVKS